jgi:hypothetical protein
VTELMVIDDEWLQAVVQHGRVRDGFLQCCDVSHGDTGNKVDTREARFGIARMLKSS